MKLEEIKSLSEKELLLKIREEKEAITNLKLRKSTLNNPKKLRESKKTVARMLTSLNQKKSK